MSEPRVELEALARGLAAHARRRGRAGLRRVALPAPPGTSPDPAVARPGAPERAAPPAEDPRAERPAAPRREPARGRPDGPDLSVLRRAESGSPPSAPPPSGLPAPAGRPAPGAERPAPGPGPARIEDAPARAAAAAPPPGEDPAERVRREAAACATLDELRAAVARCTACPLAQSRTQTVFADGAGSSGVMFVGEAPGANEDARGVPFVGKAGELLTRIVEGGMGLTRREVTIANVLKCRPPSNRDPSPEEKRICTGWLERQIELTAPRILIALGRHAAGHLLGLDAPMGRMRGRVHARGGRKIVATFHPAFLLRSPDMKPECWKDIQLAMAEVGLEPPARGRGRRG